MGYDMNFNYKKNNIWKYIILLLCLTFFSWFYTRQLLMFLANQTKAGLCTADLIISNYTDWRNGYVSYVIIMIDILFLVRNDFRYSNLIVYASRRKLWNNQVLNILKHAVIYTAYYGFCTLLFSIGQGFTDMNWDNLDSYFFKVTAGLLNVELPTIILSFFVAFAFLWITIGFEYLLFHWIWHNELFVWVMIFLVRFAVRRWVKFSIIINLGFHQWINHTILQGFLITGMLIIVLYVTGLSYARRREFLSERK